MRGHGSQSQAGAAADAGDGPGGDLSRSARRRGRQPGHKIYPYLLRNVAIDAARTRCGARDITYVPLRHGFLVPGGGDGLVQPLRAVLAIVEHAGRAASACEALDEALSRAAAGDLQHRSRSRSSRPRRSPAGWRVAGVAISMDGRGRALDNVFIERLWRSVKYEEVYLKDYADGWEAEASLGKLLRLLLPGADSPGAGLPHATGGLLPTRLKRREAVQRQSN